MFLVLMPMNFQTFNMFYSLCILFKEGISLFQGYIVFVLSYENFIVMYFSFKSLVSKTGMLQGSNIICPVNSQFYQHHSLSSPSFLQLICVALFQCKWSM